MSADDLVAGPVDALVNAYNAQDAAALRACCAEDLHYEDPLTSAPLRDAAAFLLHVRAAWAAFPGGQLTVTGGSPASGALVAAPVRLDATHGGPVGPVPATGRGLTAHAVLYCELDVARERVWRMRAFYDVYGAAARLGVLPQAGTAGQRVLSLIQGFGIPRR